jgi:predicted hydrocarbon binding protein
MVGRRNAGLQTSRRPGGASPPAGVAGDAAGARDGEKHLSRQPGDRALGKGAVDLRGSIFCEVRERVEGPLCEFYASALRRLLLLFSLDAEVGLEQCRATGAPQCNMVILVRAESGSA